MGQLQEGLFGGTVDSLFDCPHLTTADLEAEVAAAGLVLADQQGFRYAFIEVGVVEASLFYGYSHAGKFQSLVLDYYFRCGAVGVLCDPLLQSVSFDFKG
jgi:hypothetical protein